MMLTRIFSRLRHGKRVDHRARLVVGRRPGILAHAARARPAELADHDFLAGKHGSDLVADGDQMSGGAGRRDREILPVRQHVNGDEIDRALHVRIAQPKLPHVRIGDRHGHMRLDLADHRDQVRRRHLPAQQNLVADDDGDDDVRKFLGVGDGSRDLPAGLFRIAGDPHAVHHLQPVAARALEHIVAAVIDRIGADAVGVFGKERQVFVDLLGANPRAFDQRILRATERRIGDTRELFARPERRRRQRHGRAQPPPHRDNGECGEPER